MPVANSNYDGGRRKQPIGDDDVDRGKMNARNIFFANWP